MHDLSILPTDSPDEISEGDQTDDDEEHQQMGVAEGRDELRDGVIGIDGTEQFAFMSPSEGVLVASHLHPYTVVGVGGNDAYVGHDKMVVPADGKGVGWHQAEYFLRLLADKQHRVGLHHEVEVLVVVVLRHKGQRVLFAT